MGRLAVTALLLTAVASADQVWWDYDLRSNPPGWTFTDTWEFIPEGVYLYETTNGPYQYKYGEILTAGVVVPPDCDSVVLHVEQDLYMTSWGNAFSGAELQYRIDEGDWIYLFHQLVSYQSTSPLHYEVPASAWDLIEFRFEGFACTGSEMYPGEAHIDWLLYDLTLTLYGTLSLEQSTWGAIKGASFY